MKMFNVLILKLARERFLNFNNTQVFFTNDLIIPTIRLNYKEVSRL